MADVSSVGSQAMKFMDDLESWLPEDARVIGTAIVAEIAFKCPGCGNTHTMTPVSSDLTSEIHQSALLEEAAGCVGYEWTVGHTADDE